MSARRQNPQRQAFVATEAAAVVAAGAVAAALILLLAHQDVLLALPVALGYAVVVWLLWRTRRP